MGSEIRNFEAWQDMITAVCGYFTISPPQSKTFRGDIKLGRFGAMDIAEISGNVKKIQKTLGDVSRSDDANLFLILGVEGEALLEQNGRSTHLGVGDISLIDSRRPSEFKYKNGFKQISVHLPEMQTREVFRNRTIPLAKAIKSKHNEKLRNCILNMYWHAHIGESAQKQEYYDAHELLRNDECYSLLWQAIFDGDEPVSDHERDAQLCRRVNQYIEANLYDSELNLDSISQACGITRRSLHRLFERYGLSPSNWIRMRRLELARNKLMSCEDGRSCTDIAFAYGFNSSAHFSRVFKYKFGISPLQFKNSIALQS